MRTVILSLILLLCSLTPSHAAYKEGDIDYVVVNCKGSADQDAFATAEIVAYNSRTGILVPSGAGACQLTGQWKLTTPKVSLYGYPQNPAYDFGQLATHDRGNYINVINGTGGVSDNSPNNCLIDTNGQISISVNNLNFVGNYYPDGTVVFCNSYESGGDFTRYPSGNSLAAPEVSAQNSSFMGFGNVIGCANSSTDYNTCVGGTGNGTLAGNLMFARFERIRTANVGTAFQGHISDLFVKNSELTAVGSVLVSNEDTTTASPHFVGNRIEWSGGFNSNASPVIDLSCATYGATFIGNQFDFNNSVDVRIGGNNSCPYVNMGTVLFSGNTHHATGQGGNSDYNSYFKFERTKSGVVGSVVINDSYTGIQYSGQTTASYPDYIARFDGTTTDNVFFTGGNGDATACVNCPDTPYLFNTETPNNFVSNLGGGDFVKTEGSMVLGNSAVDESAILALTSTEKGVLMPRMSTAQREAISTPSEGLIVYDTTEGALYIYKSASWQTLGGGASATSEVYQTYLFDFDPCSDGTVPDGFTFTRASKGTYFDVNGDLITANNDEMRIEYDPATHECKGLKMEPAISNYFLNSATPATQNVTVTAQSYTLSFYGTGSVTMSGAHSETLNGTGANDRVTTTFTPTAGTLTLTVSGTIQYPQLENFPSATSYIAATTFAAFRAQETLDSTSIPSWFSNDNGTIITDFSTAGEGKLIGRVFYLNDGTSSNRMSWDVYPDFSDGYITVSTGGSNVYIRGFSYAADSSYTAAFTYNTDSFNSSLNAGALLPDTAGAVPTVTNFGIGSSPTGGNPLNGWVKRLRFYPSEEKGGTIQWLTKQ